jgi:peptidoglycan hydrolase CwlO-like protein
MRTLTDQSGAAAARRRAAVLAAVLLALCCAMATRGSSAPAETLGAKLSHDQAKLEKVKNRQDSLSATIAEQNAQANDLLAQVAGMRERQSAARARLDAEQAKLDRTVAELQAEQAHLRRVRARLHRSLIALQHLLVNIYVSGQPDVASMVLASSNWSDAITRSEYLSQIQSYDDGVITRAQSLRDEVRNMVRRLRAARERIARARDAIAAQEQELARRGDELQARHDQLLALRDARQSALDALEGRAQALQDNMGQIQDQIAQQAAAQASTGGTAAPSQPVAPPPPGSSATLLPDGQAVAPADAPPAVQSVIAAANSIATTPYIWGGGHGSWDSPGYDCSGAVSFALHGGGFLDSPLDSTGLETWGVPGGGSWITVYANSGHAWAVIAGLRWDTSGDVSGSGPRWHTDMASTAGFIARHPSGY